MRVACTLHVTAGRTVVSDRLPPRRTRLSGLGVCWPIREGVRPTINRTRTGFMGVGCFWTWTLRDTSIPTLDEIQRNQAAHAAFPGNRNSAMAGCSSLG